MNSGSLVQESGGCYMRGSKGAVMYHRIIFIVSSTYLAWPWPPDSIFHLKPGGEFGQNHERGRGGMGTTLI